MSKLNDLINKFCPHGVEYVKLGDIATVSKGKQLNKSNLLSDGKYAVINGGVKPTGYWNEYNYSSNRITVSQGGSCGFVDFQNNPFWAGAHCYVIVDESSSINYKFLYYILKNKEPKLMKLKHGAGIPSLAKSIVENLTIPLPPFPVQEEIVKILDKFTDLENELENELRMRKMQFNAYRDKLLTFDNGVRFEKMYKLTAWDKKFSGVEKAKQKKIVSYKYILASEFEKIKQNSGKVRYISTGISGEDQYTTDELAGDYLFEGEIVCIPGGGTPNVKYHNGKFITSDNRIATSLNKNVLNNKFLYYYLDSKKKDIEKFYRGSGIKHPDMSKVLELTIPVPPLEKQKEIVEKLDKFNDMCNEISEGLPLEIELRKKQKKTILNQLLKL